MLCRHPPSAPHTPPHTARIMTAVRLSVGDLPVPLRPGRGTGSTYPVIPDRAFLGPGFCILACSLAPMHAAVVLTHARTLPHLDAATASAPPRVRQERSFSGVQQGFAAPPRPVQEPLKASRQVQRALEPGRTVLVSDPSSRLPTLGLVCGVLNPPDSGGFGSATGARCRDQWWVVSATGSTNCGIVC